MSTDAARPNRVTLPKLRRIDGSGPQRTGFRFVGPLICLGLLLALIAIFKLLGISLRVDVMTLLGLYLSIGVESVAYLILLTAIQFPKEIFLPGFSRLVRRPEAVIAGIALGFLFLRLLPPVFAVSLLVFVLTLVQVSRSRLAAVLLPGAYLFTGLFTAFGYNVVAVTVRFKPNYDAALRQADSFLLLGHSVSELSHRFAAAVPAFITEGLFVWYAFMFVQVGAALMLCSTLIGRDYGMRFVSCILMAYAISVSIFFLFPTHDPYFACANHASSHLPRAMLDIQERFVQTATARWLGARPPLGPEYYISFPCMHIAQPLIAMWFLRRWKRIIWFLAGVNLILAFAIVILEWHYVVDLPGGILVAVASIWLNERTSGSAVSRVAC